VTDGDSQPIGYREDLPAAELQIEEPPGTPPGLESPTETLAGVLARAGAEGLPSADSGTETLSAERILDTGRCILPDWLVRLPERVVRLAGASTLGVVI